MPGSKVAPLEQWFRRNNYRDICEISDPGFRRGYALVVRAHNFIATVMPCPVLSSML